MTEGARICPACDTRTDAAKCPEDGRPTVEASRLRARGGDPFLGTLIDGKYRALKLLGTGGFGAVYLAEHAETGGKVAIKLVRAELVGEEAIIRRFYIEAQNTHQLHHHNTVRLTDFGQTDDGVLFLALEYVEGRTLQRVLEEEERLGPARAVRVAEQVLKSLAEAHDVGLVHRDVKPENIMLMDRLGEPDFVKVLDFGISRSLEGTGASTKGAIGTPMYMAPEQWRTGRGHIDGRTDLYSVGCMVYEMLAGQRPFRRDSAMGYLDAHLHEPPPRLSERAPGVCSEALGAWVHGLLAKDPEDRPPGAPEALDELVRLARAEVLSEEPLPIGPRLVDTRPVDPSVGSTEAQAASTGGLAESTARATDDSMLPTLPLTSAPRPGVLALVAVAVLAVAGVVALVASGVFEGPSGEGPVPIAATPAEQPAGDLGPDGPANDHAPRPEESPAVAPAVETDPVAAPEKSAQTDEARPAAVIPEPAEEPELPAAPAPQLRIESKPTGATVTLDGGEEPLGKTPLIWTPRAEDLARVRAGSGAELVFRAGGHREARVPVTDADLGRSEPMVVELAPVKKVRRHVTKKPVRAKPKPKPKPKSSTPKPVKKPSGWGI